MVAHACPRSTWEASKKPFWAIGQDCLKRKEVRSESSSSLVLLKTQVSCQTPRALPSLMDLSGQYLMLVLMLGLEAHSGCTFSESLVAMFTSVSLCLWGGVRTDMSETDAPCVALDGGIVSLGEKREALHWTIKGCSRPGFSQALHSSNAAPRLGPSLLEEAVCRLEDQEQPRPSPRDVNLTAVTSPCRYRKGA